MIRASPSSSVCSRLDRIPVAVSVSKSKLVRGDADERPKNSIAVSVSLESNILS